jgi:hypothetical protein
VVNAAWSKGRREENNMLKLTVAISLIAIVAKTQPASADEWVRLDRPWTYREVNQAIAYCRMLPRVHPDIGLFIDLVQGKEIERCMYTMGWVGMAR